MVCLDVGISWLLIMPNAGCSDTCAFTCKYTSLNSNVGIQQQLERLSGKNLSNLYLLRKRKKSSWCGSRMFCLKAATWASICRIFGSERNEERGERGSEGDFPNRQRGPHSLTPLLFRVHQHLRVLLSHCCRDSVTNRTTLRARKPVGTTERSLLFIIILQWYFILKMKGEKSMGL